MKRFSSLLSRHEETVRWGLVVRREYLEGSDESGDDDDDDDDKGMLISSDSDG